MTAIALRLRSELRIRWRSWLALALLVGLAGGAAIAAVAGARRTDTSYQRFLIEQKAADLTTGGFPEEVEDVDQALFQIERLPMVEQSTRWAAVAFSIETKSGQRVDWPNVLVQVDPSGRLGTAFNRFKVLEGRLFRRDAPDEALAGFVLAEQLGLRVGDRVTILLGDPENPETQMRAPVHVVGIGAAPGDFPSVGVTTYPGLYPSPGFYRANADFVSPPDSLAIRLRNGQADIAAFDRALDDLGLGPDLFIQGQQSAGVVRTTRFESRVLWLLAGLVVVVATAIVSQSLARQSLLESEEYPALRAIGVSRSQLFGLGMARATMVGAIGAAVAAGVAVALSPLTPIGMARIAEPDPGIALDGLTLTAGMGAVLVVMAVVSVIPSWRAARATSDPTGLGRSESGERPSTVAMSVARITGSPSVLTGVRMALERGRGSTAVPVRTTILGATLALAALIASLGFAASLDHTLETPGLSGFTYHAFLGGSSEQVGPMETILRNDQRVDAFTIGGFVNIEIAGQPIFGFVYQPERPVQPSLLEGRAPSRSDEIALALNTMRAARVDIGGRVRVVPQTDSGPVHPLVFRVVGKAVIPPAPFGVSPPGEGAAMTVEGWLRLDPSAAEHREEGFPYLVRFRPEVDPARAVRGIQQEIAEKTGQPAFSILSQRPGDLTSLGRISNVPVLLGFLLAAVAAATLVHTLVTSIRRRRRDLAILKTLGFVRGQVSASVGWQASTLVAVALVVGIPLGVAAGRWGWALFADRLGIVPEPVVPLLWTALSIPATVVLANMIAILPGRSAARTLPAQVLRAE